MKKPDITKRDVKAFFLGALVMFLAGLIYNWKKPKIDFKGTNTEKK
jgi:hypothetical protein